ncbi:MAG: metallophosphoesterase [Sedimentisphaerales bacterium]|nr:metallophosphoesterase [Sedimentisphaerales bacterium]
MKKWIEINKNTFRDRTLDWLVLIVLIIVIPISTGCEMKRAKFTFGIISDVQYTGSMDQELGKNRKSIDTLKKTVDRFNGKEMIDGASYIGKSRNPSFIVQLGDIIEGGPNAEKDLDQVLKVLKKARAKRYHVLGNHDFNGMDRALLMKKLGMKKAYYDFKKGKIRFVVLDTNEISLNGGWPETSANYILAKDMLEKAKQQNAPNAAEWNGAIGDQQKQWLKDVLTDAQENKQKVVVFGHHPLLPEDDKYTLWNADDITGILESYDCVVAYLNGHRHKDGYLFRNGVCYVTIEGLVEAENKDVYAVVWVYADRLLIESSADIPRLLIPFE